jgi:trans-aconitate 2-methyltransferase
MTTQPASDWDTALYFTFADERLRPALDLLARVRLAAPRVVYDLGCGGGNVTRALRRRWPGARITGVDSSEAMLAKARTEAPDIAFEAADLASWRAPEPADVIYSNAALHWLPDHGALVPRLLDAVAPGGVLAIQMPRNFGEPSHTSIFETAADGPWAPALTGRMPAARPVADPDAYIRMLRPLTAALDVWETVYWQVLSGDDPVLDWTRATWLRPVLDAVPAEHRDAFLAAHAARLRAAYKSEPDGRTLFPFRRLFIVATKRG